MHDPDIPDTPHVSGRRLGEYFAGSRMGTPGTPDMVADAIWRAITDDDRHRAWMSDLSGVRVNALPS